jgi:hypothetical protein
MRFLMALVLSFQFASFAQARDIKLASRATQGSQVRAYIQRDSIWSPVVLMVDGKPNYYHFFSGFSDLTETMALNPDAVAFAERARVQHIWASSLMWGGLAAAIAYTIVAESPNHHWDGGTYWTVFLVPFIPGAFLQGASMMNTNKAINAYNGIPQRLGKLIPNKINLAPSKDGAVAALTWEF